MLTVTEGARDRLASKLANKSAADDVAMRFTRKKNGWKLRMDQGRPDDTTYTREGRSILLLDANVSKAMTAMKLDVRSTKAGARLILSRVARQVD
jgi:hypothetical protein